MVLTEFYFRMSRGLTMIHKSFDAKYLTYLARFIRKRDKEAFAELYNYTHKKIDQYALQFLKDPHLAQDAVQEIYILIYKNIDSLKEDSLFLSWMNQITYHVCCDFLRKVRSQSYEQTDFSSDPKVLNIPSDDDCFRDISDRDFLEHYREALDSLSYQERQTFLLRYDHDFKLEEIADFLNCLLSSVKRYLKSSKRHLAERLRSFQN